MKRYVGVRGKSRRHKGEYLLCWAGGEDGFQHTVRDETKKLRWGFIVKVFR